jgi:DNA-binding transcriptional regulator GbsR (MarR family)
MKGSEVDELKELLRKVNRGLQDAKDSLSRDDLEETQDILGDLLSPLAKAERSLEELVKGTSYWEVFEGDLLSEEPIRKDLRDLRDSIKENLSGLEKELKGRFCQNFRNVKKLVSELDEAFQKAPERAVGKLI